MLHRIDPLSRCRRRSTPQGLLCSKKIKFLVALFFLAGVFNIAAPNSAFANPLIIFYQKVISPVDGDRCPMFPSCSEYARQAMEKHGPVIGLIMAFDRLQRCGRDTVALSGTIIKKGTPLAYDPVEFNDFWWFEKDKKR